MALENEYTSLSELSTDIYRIAEYVDSIKQRYIDVPEDTLALGMFGYLSAIFSNLIENTATQASEYANEAVPIKAKFEKNVIAHALSFGINEIFATPAEADVIMFFPEDVIIANMNRFGSNNKFVIDKEMVFSLGDDKSFPYHLDHDIVLRRDKLPNGSWVYNARYNIDNKNEFVELYNPYLPAIDIINLEGTNMIQLKTILRQYTHTEIYKKITVSNPLESKILTFDYQDQLAFFYVDVVEDDDVHYLKPIYDGLYDYTSKEEFINYIYLDETHIRLTFNRDSYTPRKNAEVTIHVYTTLGSECNFAFPENYRAVRQLKSTRYTYDGVYCLITPFSDSQYGSDKLTVDQLKTVIPREALSRGVITTYSDLNNSFNAIQTEDCKLYFLEKVHNQLSRLFYCYLLLKEGDNVIPTNTINPIVNRGTFSATAKNCFTIRPGAAYYVDPKTQEIRGIKDPTETELNEYDNTTFLYMNPFLTVINKSPFYVSYYLTILDYVKYLHFEYVNEDSILQFIALSFRMHRDYFTDPDTYKVEVVMAQNIRTDFQIINYTDQEIDLDTAKIKSVMVLYQTDNEGQEFPTRYCEGELDYYDESDYSYRFTYKFKTKDQINPLNTYMTITEGLKTTSDGIESTYAVAPNMKMKIFILAKLTTSPKKGRVFGWNELENFDDIVPGYAGYTLTNVYSAGDDGLDIFYDYSDINYSYIEMTKNPTTNTEAEYIIYKMPVVRYRWLDQYDQDLSVGMKEKRFKSFFSKVDKRRRYIQNLLLLLENSFDIDYKLFNTYGPSLMYNIDNETNVNRINLSLKFEVKFQIPSEKAYLPMITNSIKQYIEDLNYVSDLHMPNLITYITNIYREQLVYFKFIKLNNYGTLHQSIYKNPGLDSHYFEETQTVPEYINVNTLNNDLPDITYKIVE